MEVLPVSVGVASRAWDEQHLDLAAASRQVADAGSAGFSPAVTGSAARFLAAWTGHTAAVGEECEWRADGLRAAIRDYLATEDAVVVDLVRLLAYLEERR